MSILGFKEGEVIPDHILTKMKPEDRPKGKIGMTTEEATAKAEVQKERELHRMISDYIGMRGVQWIIHQPMNKRSQLAPGTPDFLFCYRGQAVAIEAKTATGKLSDEQKEATNKMYMDGWFCRVAHSIGDVKEELDAIDKRIELMRKLK